MSATAGACERKYASGFQKRKAAAERRLNINAQKDTLLKFVKVEKVLDLNTSSEISDANEEEELKTVEINNDSLNNSNFDTELIPIRDENADVDNLLADDSGFELLNDPGKWPENITDRIRLYLVKNIPPQGRKFNPLHYDRVLPNGERVNRSWLLYSECKNKVYCCSCYLFSNELGKCSLGSKGNSDWRDLGEILASHKGSAVHSRAQLKLLDLQKRLDCEATLDATEQRLMNAEIQHWRSVLKRIIICIQYLAKHNETLRGSGSTI
ncbi:hypothetical protein CBL_20088 [Carabus blaptoides fortunei]